MGQDTPNVRAVRPDKDRCLVIIWRGGMERLVDLSDHIAEYVIFAPLRADNALFRNAAVGEWGWCGVAARVAKTLGVSPRMWRCYESGSHLLPETVRLAGIGLDAQTRAA